MRRASKRDRNEPEIRKRAEARGFLWLENNASTKGRPDACLLRNGHTYWCEVKVPGEPFTQEQMREFPRIVAMGVPVYVLECPEDVDSLGVGTLAAWTLESVKKVWSPAGGRKKREHRPGYDRALSYSDMCTREGCVTSRLGPLLTCAKHVATREVATVENGLLPAPRKTCQKGR